MSNNPDDHFHYGGCFTRPNRRSPTAPGSNNNTGRRGFFGLGQGGRTVLPPLHLPFRGSRSPAPEQSYPAHQYPQQDAAQGRSDYNVPYGGQPDWPINPNLTQGHQQTSYQPDPRYPAPQPSYPSYSSRATPSIPTDPHDPRILPPLSSQQQGHIYSGIPNQPMASSSHGRSPTTGYPNSYASGYPSQSQQQGSYPYSTDPRNPMASLPFDTSSGAPIPRRSSMSVDRTVPSRLSVHAPLPYARQPPQMGSTYTPEPVEEPMIKKKRKRADAEQLKVLNETYARTAFPSTEERIELAKKLGMSARSVQIWFQNKRQAMRQSTRQASVQQPATTTEPFVPQAQHPTAGASMSQPMYHPGPVPNTLPSASMAGQGYNSHRTPDPYGRSGPSPTPSQYRPRSRDDDGRPHRSPSRPY